MKRLIVLTLALLPAMANAGQITLILSDEEETVAIRLSQQSHYTMTLEED
ncbi:hypothetical protein [Enterobacter mori]